MKPVIYKLLYFSFLALLSTSPFLQSCNDEEEAKKWVDLRYRVNDSYLVEAKDPAPISFKVKSTSLWEVFGKYDWHTISPNTGEPGEVCTVTITCKENTDLDDRTDTIHIKSDYWTGKQFVVMQKGTAYLNAEGGELISQAGGSTTFHVLANQKWTAQITEGATWLSMQSGTSGESDGQITVQAQKNTGEQRTAIITLYDRHGKTGQEVKCTQGGVVLDPEVPANEKFYTIYQEEQLFTIHIESNTEWEASKKNEKDDDWYTFQKTSFNGSDNLVMNVSAHTGISVRTGTIVLKTKASEGTTPVEKTIRFKQANPPFAKVTDLNKTITSGTSYYGPDKLIPGRYNFYLEPLGKTQLNFFFIWKGVPSSVELRYHILNGKTNLSTTPYCNDVNSGIKSTIHEVDTSKPHTLSFVIQEAVDTKDPTLSWIYTEWILDDKVIAKATSDGIADLNGDKDNWIVPFARASAGGNFLFKATSGDAVLTKYEYIRPPEWGE